MSRKTPDEIVEIALALDELDLTASEAKATYSVINRCLRQCGAV